jgi:uncharacterized protein (TIGR02147 family)
MNDIYSYSDYRAFIRDYYETRKSAAEGFSYRQLAEQAGINSTSYFKFVIDGKRNLTQKSIFKSCLALGLRDKEAEYFENLVYFNQAKTPEEKNTFFGTLLALQQYRNVAVIERDQMEIFSEWHHCVIRELAVMADFGTDYARLGRMLNPPIPAAKAEASLALLVELGFLRKQGDGYVQAEPVVSTGPASRDNLVMRHQVRMLQLAKETFERCRAQDRYIGSTTIGVSRATFLNVVRKVRDFRSHLMEIVSHDGFADQVYQLTFCLIPLSGKSGVES